MNTWLRRLRRPQAATTIRQRLLGSLALLLTGALAACGGGSGSAGMAANGCGAATCGAAVVTITDAPGDFLSYTVNIVSLKLQRDDGQVVETLPVTTAVDFAKLVDLTEVISARQIPPGKYVGGSVTLDYNGATIVVDDGTTPGGVSVNPVDSTGAALGTVEMQVQLDSNKPLLITSKSAGHIAFDFNLLASNTLDSTTAPTTVTVNPVLVASIVPPDHKDLRVRGPLVSADTAANTYTVTVKPFYSDSTSQGDFTVHVNSATSYEIDGVAYSGDAGLEQLATVVSAGTLTAAFGTLTTADHVFTATRVLAGSSVENSHQDGIDGVVVARVDNALTIRGATLERRDGRCGFDKRQVTVNVDATTGVTKEGNTGAFAIGDISVGQRIHAFGKLDLTSGQPVLDATGAAGGHVRLEVTSLWGVINTATPGSEGAAGSVDLSLKSIEGFWMASRHGTPTFDFTGTGIDATSDATAAHYLVDTGILSLPPSFVAGYPARFFGFVTPFGQANPNPPVTTPPTPPTANFTAVTLVDYAQTHSWLKVDWADPGVTAPFVTPLAASGLTLGDLSAATRHSLSIGPAKIDLTTLSTAVQIVGDTSPTAVFAIAHEATHTTDTYNDFAAFVAALSTALDDTNTAEHVIAEGTFDSSTNVLTATHMAVVMEN